MYLLDTNVISDIAKNPAGMAAQRFAMEPSEVLVTSIIVSAEVQFGLNDARVAARTRNSMLRVLNSLRVVGLDSPADTIYASIRSHAKQTGRQFGPNDLLIAAHAIALSATLVTDDQALQFVPGLAVENWIRDTPF